jgi:hypothetical protein
MIQEQAEEVDVVDIVSMEEMAMEQVPMEQVPEMEQEVAAGEVDVEAAEVAEVINLFMNMTLIIINNEFISTSVIHNNQVIYF